MDEFQPASILKKPKDSLDDTSNFTLSGNLTINTINRYLELKAKQRI